jgi:hypothetical protein
VSGETANFFYARIFSDNNGYKISREHPRKSVADNNMENEK